MQANQASKILPWIAAVAFFMQSLDSTILNTALPSIARSLNHSPLAMQSAVISYILTVAMLIPISGWLADRFGTKNIFSLAVTLFALGSLFCALSNSLTELVIARILQGMGGAIMMPVARLALLKAYPRTLLLPILNFVSIPGLIGPVLGPLLGGWLVTYASWHWIFLINIPIGIIGILIAQKHMPNFKDTSRSFDFIGFILFGASLVLFSIAIELFGEQITTPIISFIILLLGICSLITYIWHSKRITDPLIKLNVFKIRTFSIGILGNLASRLGTGAIPFLIPLMLQVGFGYSALIAGLMMMPFAIGSLVAKSFVTRLLGRLGYRNVLISITLLIGFTISSLSLQPTQFSLWLLALPLFLLGCFTSIQFTSMNTLTLGGLPDDKASVGNSLLAATQQLAISFGIAVGATILRFYKIYNEGHILQNFYGTLVILGIITILSSIVFTYLHKTDGDTWK